MTKQDIIRIILDYIQTETISDFLMNQYFQEIIIEFIESCQYEINIIIPILDYIDNQKEMNIRKFKDCLAMFEIQISWPDISYSLYSIFFYSFT